MQIVVCSFQQLVVVPALAFAPFGIPAPVFWIYVCALVIFISGLIKIIGELRQEHGVDKIMPVGRLFFAIPLAVFGSEHFTFTANVAGLVPRWIPAHTFWVYLTGLAFLAAALSMAALVQARLAAALVGMTLLIFVLVMDLPAAVANPQQQIFLGSGPETTCLQRRRFRFRDVAREHAAETGGETVGASTADRRLGMVSPSAILPRAPFPILWSGASAASGIRAGSSAAKAHSRMDPRANFLELFCWRDFDSRWRLLTRK